jgi:hypothetical protein
MVAELKPEPETIKGITGEIIDKGKHLIHEGNIRRIVVERDEHTVVELPVTVGVVAAVFAPLLAAIGAIVAVLTNCTMKMKRTDTTDRTEQGT